MTAALRAKIAALEALAASTTFEGERENALSAVARLRANLPPDETPEPASDGWREAIDAIQTELIIVEMVKRAREWFWEHGTAVYRDGGTYVIVGRDIRSDVTDAELLNMAVNGGFVP